MFKKLNSLLSLEKQGLNAHAFYVPTSFMAFLCLVYKLGTCTVRTDSKIHTASLPFYVLNTKTDLGTVYYDIWKEARENKYILIVSDGIKCDSIQEYNMVVKFEKNGDFFFEASDMKVPLRNMYKTPERLLSAYGNISEEVSEWSITNNVYGIDRIDIKRDLENLYAKELHGKWLEITKYPQEVGLLKEDIVFWQVY